MSGSQKDEDEVGGGRHGKPMMKPNPLALLAGGSLRSSPTTRTRY